MNKEAFDYLLQRAKLAVNPPSVTPPRALPDITTPPVSGLPPASLSQIDSKLHKADTASPRGQIATAIRQQQVRPTEYKSPVGMYLLHRRNPQALLNQTPNPANNFLPGSGPAYASGLHQQVFVEPKPPSPAALAADEGVTNMNTLGYAGIANHELSHLQQGGYNRRAIDTSNEATRSLSQAMNVWPTPKPENVKIWERYRDRQYGDHNKIQDKLMEFAKDERARSEIAPSIGDLVFAGEQFKREQGKPLDHKVQLPGGVTHDINWMRQQAQRHGYWDGRPMDDMIYNTPEGRQWLKRMAGNQ